MLHPASIHFAIVIPLLSLVLGIAYLFKPSELMSKISTRFMLFGAIFLTVAFFTGKSDASEVYPLLSSDAQLLLKEHKNLALYLVLGMWLATVIKMFACIKKIIKIEIFAIVLVGFLSVGILYQGKMGGELTYTYGANVVQYSDGMDCLDDPEEFLEE
ncbi:MAG: hypothetical protein J7J96_00560 [Sulfurimonas sp.]|nr:hypothetical protein [Sulfurimonas sp.]